MMTYRFAFLRLLFIIVILSNSIFDIGSAKIFKDFSDDFFSDPDWTFINGWHNYTDNSGNSQLKSDEIHCGERAAISINVNYNNQKSITFDCGKIGTYSKFICYYDNNTDPQHSRSCNRPSLVHDRIIVPPGPHKITWDLSVASCESGPGSVAYIDNISIPIKTGPDCAISTNAHVVIGQESIASVPFFGADATYEWQIPFGGIIKSPKPYTNLIRWKATEIGTTLIKVSVSSRNVTCTNISELVVSDREVVNVTDYMNLGDIIKKSENKILLLKNGTYTDSLIINAKNLKITSENMSGVVFDARSSDYGILIDNTSDVTIDGLNLTDCRGGFIIYNSTNCTIDNNTITSKNKPGIFVDSSSFNVIRNNTLRSSAP